MLLHPIRGQLTARHPGCSGRRVDPPSVARAARLLQACELRYWNTLNEDST
jgi:hypothetical protein